MSEEDVDRASTISRLADGLLPALIARLDASELGELEVRAREWRIRLRKPFDRRNPVAIPDRRRRSARAALGAHASPTSPMDAGAARAAGVFEVAAGASSGAGTSAGTGSAPEASGDGAPGAPGVQGPQMATSPTVGYYVPREAYGSGRAVGAGEVVAYVDCLGIRQEVVSPADGVLDGQLAQPGEAVEYGQPLVLIEVRAERVAERADPAPTAASTAASAAASAASAAEPARAAAPAPRGASEER